MRAWCALAVLLGAIAGCDDVLGLEERPGIEIAVTDLRILGTPPTTDEVREVRAIIHGAANASQAYDLTATAGVLVPANGEAELDDNGQVEITAMYRATTRGAVTIAAMAGDASATLTFAVFERVLAGLETGNMPLVVSPKRPDQPGASRRAALDRPRRRRHRHLDGEARRVHEQQQPTGEQARRARGRAADPERAERIPHARRDARRRRPRPTRPRPTGSPTAISRIRCRRSNRAYGERPPARSSRSSSW